MGDTEKKAEVLEDAQDKHETVRFPEKETKLKF